MARPVLAGHNREHRSDVGVCRDGRQRAQPPRPGRRGVHMAVEVAGAVGVGLGLIGSSRGGINLDGGRHEDPLDKARAVLRVAVLSEGLCQPGIRPGCRGELRSSDRILREFTDHRICSLRGRYSVVAAVREGREVKPVAPAGKGDRGPADEEGWRVLFPRRSAVFGRAKGRTGKKKKEGGEEEQEHH